CSAGDVGARRYAVRLAFGSLRPRPRIDVVHPRVLGLHRLHSYVTDGGGAGFLARNRGHRTGWGMGGRVCAGGGDVAGAASRKGDRIDAVGVGSGLPAGGAAGRSRAAVVGMASIVPGRIAAGAGDALDPPQYPGATEMDSTRAQPGRDSGRAVSSASVAPRDPVHGDVLLRTFRLLGHVHVAAGLSVFADGARRRRAQRGSLLGVDRPASDWRVLRLLLIRLLCGPGGAASGLPHLCPDDGPAGPD